MRDEEKGGEERYTATISASDKDVLGSSGKAGMEEIKSHRWVDCDQTREAGKHAPKQELYSDWKGETETL